MHFGTSQNRIHDFSQSFYPAVLQIIIPDTVATWASATGPNDWKNFWKFSSNNVSKRPIKNDNGKCINEASKRHCSRTFWKSHTLRELERKAADEKTSGRHLKLKYLRCQG
jgi:hypothetical protein